ncbi:nitrilase-related carbon-nitrogen hydrolase [Kribbella qitaiheensis]|uniref:nitrilase-related carbon-nitrogen hydrolase n=1 Tax=Kribbella qitaiheensis TaxID=1544730 RepID=UPI002483B67F|nr:nitrilase-related carbon-nitrogen hydrolase [Kribbella qitaiheensis]
MRAPRSSQYRRPGCAVRSRSTTGPPCSRPRAIENTCYVAAAAQNGKKYSGLSQVIDPQGIAIAAVGEADGHAVAEISADRLAKIRTQNPSLQNRRYTVTPR